MMTRTQVEAQRAQYQAQFDQAMMQAQAYSGAVEALDWVLSLMPEEKKDESDANAGQDAHGSSGKPASVAEKGREEGQTGPEKG